MPLGPHLIKRVLYTLKRQHGVPVTLMQRTSSTVDLPTGNKTVAYRSIDIARALELPDVSQRKFAYDLAFIFANRSFTYGAHFDIGMKRFLIDQSDMGTFQLKLDDYIIFNNKRYEVKQLEEVGQGRAFDVTAVEVKTGNNYRIITQSITSVLAFNHEVVPT